MDLLQIGRLLGYILAQLVLIARGQQSLEGAVLEVGRTVAATDVGDSLTHITEQVDGLYNNLVTGGDSNHNQTIALNALTNNGTITLQSILAAIAALPAGSSLPTSGAIAGDVWGVTDLASQVPHLTYGEELAQSHQWAAMMWHAGSLPARWAPFFNISPPVPGIDSRPTVFTWPKPDWTDIQPTDTLLSWLERTEPDFAWTDDIGSGGVIGYAAGGDEAALPHYTSRLTSAEWQTLYIPRHNLAPIWPGLAGVTLGTPVAISPGFTITEPMHGVIVAITAVAAKQMYYTYDDLRAYRHIGALAFLDDNGDAEGWQSLGFVSAVYCCRSMEAAAAVKIMSANGTVGTVTPWLRSS